MRQSRGRRKRDGRKIERILPRKKRKRQSGGRRERDGRRRGRIVLRKRR
jgi:hypothetical protein